jgi:acetoin utilization deacetylase AcuC-like enzyme
MKKIIIFSLCFLIYIGIFISICSANDKKVGVMYDERFLLHDTGPNHPENPDRLISVIRDLKNNNQIASKIIWPNFEAATFDELSLVHTKEYIELVDRQVTQLKNNRAYLSTGDTPISKHTNLVAKLAVGAGLEAVDQIILGEISSAFALVRPPGHHATATKGMGFCVYNSVAVVARYLQDKYGLKRILIVDFDVHHGNGTQDIFYEEDSVFYFSVHQHPFYPQSGRPNEIGLGKGKGYTLNVDLPKGSGDKKLIKAFSSQLKPAMDKFKPEFILVSAGFDAHEGDLLGQLKYSDNGYENVALVLQEIANRYSSGRLLYMLEGGYVPENISKSVTRILSVLIENSMAD